MWPSLLLSALSSLSLVSAVQEPLPRVPTPQRAQERELYLLHYDTGELHAFEPDTRVVRLVGRTGLLDPAALSAGPDGHLYSFTTDGRFWKIDPRDAQTMFVGNLGLSNVFEGGLAIDDEGRALGFNEGNGITPGLFEVDLTTGAAQFVGTPGIGDFNGLAFREDGKLIALDRIHNSLWVIDPDDLSRTLLTALLPAVGAAGGVTIQEGIGFFVTGGTPGTFGGTHELWTFDPFTGSSRMLVPLPDNLEGVGVAGLCYADPEAVED